MSETLHMHYDTENEALVVTTPKGLRIVLSDKDQSIRLNDLHRNTLTMNHEGIALHSPLKISINAGAELALKASGQVTINGAMVMIN